MSREDILSGLREEFRANTRERLAEMNDLVATIDEALDLERVRVLERHFHGLAGLGGTYGYANVTALSREGEDICEDGASGTDSLDLRRLSEIVSQLLAAIERTPDNE